MEYRYKKTRLWQTLKDKEEVEANGIIPFLDNSEMMPKIETILSKSASSPKDFTLHDQDHAYRVAERIYNIIPTDTIDNLSSYECMFLLLSAYLHDIGMSPTFKQISSINDYLLFGKKDNISDDELAHLDEFIFKNYGSIEFPLDHDELNYENFKISNEIVTYYSRFMHNDWSEEWIKINLKEQNILPNYPNWSDDLIKICKSHHYGFDILKKDYFDPVRVNNQIVHLRYIAMCLRIGDVLELDPERTPEVILKHRNISNNSLIYWYKDQYIDIQLADNLISLTARPKNASIHKAIEETSMQIEDELNMCNRLVLEKPLSFYPPHNNLPHEWKLKPTIFKGITPYEDRYTYIDTSFKINTKRIIELLAGTQLYRSPLVAIREMLQNSFDAIKECIAYERLACEDPFDEKIISSIQDGYSVNLILEKEGNDIWLTCADNGIGMTKELLSESFLVSGATKHYRIHQLEKKCKKVGFSTERTGQFGIGVLSYFMITDDIIISTRRREFADDYDANGWKLSIPGLFGFGELVNTKLKVGTKIKLKIKPKIISKHEDFEMQIIKELNTFLSYLPCRFSFKSKISNNTKAWQAGWAKNESYYSNQLIDAFIKEKEKNNKYSYSKISQSTYERVINENKKYLKWITKEGKLENGLGIFKIYVPYYSLPIGNSFAYIQHEDYCQEIELLYDSYFIPSFENSLSWNGIRVNNYNLTKKSKFKPYFYTINFTSTDVGKINVSREELKIEKEKEIESFLDNQFDELIHKSTINFKNKLVYFNSISLNEVTDKILFPHKLENKTILSKLSDINIAIPFGSSRNKSIVNSKYQFPINLNKFDFGYDIKSKEMPPLEKYLKSSHLLINRDFSLQNDNLFMGNVCGFKKTKEEKSEKNDINILQFPAELDSVYCIKYLDNIIINRNNYLTGSSDQLYDPFALENHLRSIYSFTTKDPEGFLSFLMDDKFKDIREKLIKEAKFGIESIFDIYPDKYLILSFCNLVDDKSVHLVSNDFLETIKLNESNFGEYEKEYFNVCRKLLDLSIPNKLNEIIKESESKQIQFIDFYRSNNDKGIKCVSKVFTSGGVQLLNDEQVIKLFQSVDDDWKFELLTDESKN